MCGIIACIGSNDAVGELVTGLENLEYRGYDSAGIAVQNGSGIEVRKRAGKISELKESISRDMPDGGVGIGHTRWSTHGPPTDENAHPHTTESSRVAVVHNGIIENYEALRHRLEREGRTFTSETDTEVIPHLVEHYMDEGLDAEDAFRSALDELEGSFAVALMVYDEDVVYAARQDSPLVLGVDDGTYYLASDVPAFREFTADVFGGRLQLAGSTRLFGSAYVQYNEATDELISNVRFNFIHAPLSDVFLVYRERRAVGGGGILDRRLTAKVTRVFAF